MAGFVNLLLLLSALLSALTGGASAMRTPAAAHAAASAVVAVQTAASAARIAYRPQHAMASLAGLAAAPLPVSPLRLTDEPLYASRRRE